MFKTLVSQTRTVRRFLENKSLARDVLHDLIDFARLSGSARNAQALKYMIITDDQQRQDLFLLLAWAGYLSNWPGPEAGERPPAYILCLLDTSLQKGPLTEVHFDLGIASQNLLLGAAEQGIFGCRIGAFVPARVQQLFNLPAHYSVLLVLALGYPGETVVLEEVGEDADIRYWHDEKGIHHVPKRRLADVLVALPLR